MFFLGLVSISFVLGLVFIVNINGVLLVFVKVIGSVISSFCLLLL